LQILWVCPFFLHPTNRGGQIRSLGTLRELHKRHTIHYAALNDPANLEGPRLSAEYASSYTAVPHTAPARRSLAVVPQLLGSFINPQPLAVSRFASAKLRDAVRSLLAERQFDAIVCDFLHAAPNVPDLRSAVLFQHNVETTIWQRHLEREQHPLKKRFIAMQVRKMEAYERSVCQQSRFVIAVSDIDAERMREMFSISHVESVPTGVDIDSFAAPTEPVPVTDVVFSGSMDWLPNVDAIEYFLAEIFPLIRARRPDTTFTIAGRSPDPRVRKAAEGVPGVTITGSVPDMRPFLWGSRISIVSLRIGGGTRLKVYESMAAGCPVVSTTIGAEGLDYNDGQNILIADTPQTFADACLRLLQDTAARRSIAENALHLVRDNFSWASVTRRFESILEAHRAR
jgi:glycosyltransferase involved in cell wall biosynthesis